ncbi:MAG: T9SS type A sorting domain-containing protein [Flavobacteriaceae bacterium]|nr:T9SS type A sorting domain-containing protein [Flavobacteriaceae bacterium]
MKKITSNKLLNYGAMSAAILGTADAAGQFVYTNLDPDQSVATGEAFPFDLNGDSIDDFSLDIFDAAGGAGAVIFPGVNGSVNSMNGLLGTSSGGFTYPYNLSSGATIGAGEPFIVGDRGDLNFYSCAYPGSNFCGGVTDGFIGLVFDLGGNTHYGWVRIDLSADATSMTVKDFAYESTPGMSITAGDGLGVEDNAFEGFALAVNNDILTMRSSTPLDNVQLYDILGKQVISQNLSSTNESVNIGELRTGIYIARVSIEGVDKTFKIVKK